MLSNKHRKISQSLITAILLAGVATDALAQSQPTKAEGAKPEEELQEIFVTGSRIKRAGFDTVQPASVVDAALLKDRATNNIGDLLNKQPGFGVPGSSSVGGQSDLSVGQSFVDFLGLGSQRTLTVVNGMRFPAANTPAIGGPATPGLQVDLNTIPTALIDRVETIAIGGSPIYGADAIAGTVNIILKKRFTGFEAEARAGLSGRGDAPEQNFSALYGTDFANAKGNVVFSLQYNQAKGLLLSEREETARQWFFAPPAEGVESNFTKILFPDRRVVINTFTGLPLLLRPDRIKKGEPQIRNVPTPDGGIYQIGPNGTFINYDQGTPTGIDVFSSGGEGINLAETEALSINSDRFLANVFTTYNFDNDISLRLEGWYSRARGRELTQQPEYSGTEFFRKGIDTDARVVLGAVPIRLDNPYVSDQARDAVRAVTGGAPVLDLDNDGVQDTEGFYVEKGYRDIFRGAAGRSTQNFMRFFGELTGQIALGKHDFDWQIGASFGQAKTKSTSLNILINEFNQAKDAVRSPNGTITCRDPSNGCQPLNILGDSNASEAAINFVTAKLTNETSLSQLMVTTHIAGDIFTLPAGSIGAAMGADFRREKSTFRPDAIASSGRTRASALTAVDGAFSSREVYGELRVPLVSADMSIPLVHKIGIEGAARFVSNSASGGALTWTVGGGYAPINGVEFRGNYTRSIRAPAVTELFLPTTELETDAADPCDYRIIEDGLNPDRRAANCAAAGIEQPFSSEIVDATKIVTQQGNPNLKNEEARAWSAGLVLKPQFLPGVIVAVDWIDIRLKNAIELFDTTTTLKACYDSADYPNAAVCKLFTRDTNGQIATVKTGYRNAGLVRFAGMTANAELPINIGEDRSLMLSANYLYTKTNTRSVTGSDFYENAGNIGYSKHRVSASAGYSAGVLGLNLQGEYFSPAVFDTDDRPGSRDIPGVKSFIVMNGNISVNIDKRYKLQLNIENILDAKAPKYSSAGGGIATSTYYQGLLGRSFSVTASFKM
jgi:iron complex outermembrane recepter protein